MHKSVDKKVVDKLWISVARPGSWHDGCINSSMTYFRPYIARIAPICGTFSRKLSLGDVDCHMLVNALYWCILAVVLMA